MSISIVHEGMQPQMGTLYGIGVGPGDPELLTVKAFRLMKQCPVIAYPKKKIAGASYALDIVNLYIDPAQKQLLGLVFPMTKDKQVLEQQWADTVSLCWELLQAGKDIAFLTEGDPNFYSTFIHLARRMQAQHPEVPIRSVPGISSMLGAAANLGLPLADGDESIAIVPASSDTTKMREALRQHDTVIFLKVAKVLEETIHLLEELGLAAQASVVTKVTSRQELIWRNVQELKGQAVEYLTLMVVKK